MLMANSAAILTDAFPDNQRGMALGVNQAAAFSGVFIGLVLGGLLAPLNWRWIFLVSVPIGLFGTVLGYLELRETEPAPAGPHRLARQHHLRPRPGPGHGRHHLRHRALRRPRHGLDQPGGARLAWPSACVLLVAFCVIETRVPQPMFRLQLFKIRAFTSGVLASFLAALSRGGLMFMLIIWLQGIWLPLHGYDFAVTPLWAGIAMLPLTIGFLVAGPLSGILSDRFGPRPFATGGMLGTAACFVLLELLPVDFPYWVFALLLFVHRAVHGLVRLAQPGRGHEQPAGPAPGGRLGDEHHVPELGPGPLHRHLLHADDRGHHLVAVRPTCCTGWSPTACPPTWPTGWPTCHRSPRCSPPSSATTRSSTWSGPHVLAQLTPAQQSALTGRSFFPGLISRPFQAGLHAALDFAIVGQPAGGVGVVAAGRPVRLLRGRRGRCRRRPGRSPGRPLARPTSSRRPGRSGADTEALP